MADDHMRPAIKHEGLAATSEVPILQAILLADSFEEKFRPITIERPKVLLPLVNRPMIDYTLAWLESAGVDEVFVFCCAHSKQIIAYLDKSCWCSKPNFRVTAIESHDSFSTGDALRFIHKLNVIHGDFVLIGGDTVTNMSLNEALQEHKDRRRKDYSAIIMTMVIGKTLICSYIHQSNLGIDELFMAIHPDTKQLLYYDPSPKGKTDFQNASKYLEKNLLLVDKRFHQNKQDCYIDICSPQVLSLFNNNVHYQHLRGHLAKKLLLVDDMMGLNIYTHEIETTYADKVDNFRSYDNISKSIIRSRENQLVSDDVSVGNFGFELTRLIKARLSARFESDSEQICRSVIGKGTSIGNNTKFLNSVIGEGCVIGLDVSIEGCYIWNNVAIADGCKLKHALICEGAVLKRGVVLKPGVVLSFNVVIGQHFVVPAYSKVSLLQPPNKQYGNEIVRAGGDGYIWCREDEEWKHSVAPIPFDKFDEIMKADYVELFGDAKVDNIEDFKDQIIHIYDFDNENAYSGDSEDED